MRTIVHVDRRQVTQYRFKPDGEIYIPLKYNINHEPFEMEFPFSQHFFNSFPSNDTITLRPKSKQEATQFTLDYLLRFYGSRSTTPVCPSCLYPLYILNNKTFCININCIGDNLANTIITKLDLIFDDSFEFYKELYDFITSHVKKDTIECVFKLDMSYVIYNFLNQCFNVLINNLELEPCFSVFLSKLIHKSPSVYFYLCRIPRVFQDAIKDIDDYFSSIEECLNYLNYYHYIQSKSNDFYLWLTTLFGQEFGDKFYDFLLYCSNVNKLILNRIISDVKSVNVSFLLEHEIVQNYNNENPRK